jgi:hypothetical protein
MKKFRLPRKEKKSLKRGFWLYPPDEKGNSLMALPTRKQKDYDALKKGVLRNLFDPKRLKEGAKKQAAKIDPEIYIPDDQLKDYVDDIFREDLRSDALRTFIRAKNSETASKAYFNFVNAYNLYKEGNDSYSNICCLALDRAESLLRKENSTRRNRK